MKNDDLFPNTMLWRYMPLRYFESVLKNQIWFSRPSSFPDRWEGLLPASLGHNFSTEQIETLKDSLCKTDQINRHAYLVNCWHISNEESADMWDHYGSVPDGIAIQSTVADVKDCIFADGSAEVEYYDPSEIMPPQPLFGVHPILFKRKQFCSEKEYRVWRVDEGILARIFRKKPLVELALPKGRLVHVSNISNLLRRVVLSPGASPQTRKTLEELCRFYKRTWIHGRIMQSALDMTTISAD